MAPMLIEASAREQGIVYLELLQATRQSVIPSNIPRPTQEGHHRWDDDIDLHAEQEFYLGMTARAQGDCTLPSIRGSNTANIREKGRI